MNARRYAKRKLRQFIVIIIVMILIILGYIILKEKKEEQNSVRSDDEIFYQLEQSGDFVNVAIETEQGKITLPLEIYVYRVVTSWKIEDTLPEYLKVLCVLCRTEIIRVGLKEDTLLEIPSSCLSTSYQYHFSRQAYQAKNKMNQEVLQAVYDTKGIIMTKNAAPVFCPFFALSAGTTRSASMIEGMEQYNYLQVTECPEDYMSEDYLQKVSMSREFLLNTVNEHLEEVSDCFMNSQQVHTVNQEKRFQSLQKIKIVQYENSNYIKQVIINDQKDIMISGDDFRRWFSLSSSAFSIQINQQAISQNDQVVIITKGIGHGFGLSMYHAEKMAESGSSYQQILLYFFPSVKFDIYA